MVELTLADPRGRQELAPLTVQFLSFSGSFRLKSCQIIGFCPKLGGWRPLWEILDPPLIMVAKAREFKAALNSHRRNLLIINYDKDMEISLKKMQSRLVIAGWTRRQDFVCFCEIKVF